MFNSLQTFALNSTSASAGAGIPVVLILFFFFFLDQLWCELDSKSSFPFQTDLTPRRAKPSAFATAAMRPDFHQKTPPHALTSVPSQGLDFDTNSAVFLTTPNGTWPPPSTWLLQCLRYQHWQLLCAALVLLSTLLHSKATTFFCHRIQSKPLMKPLSKCWLPSFIAAPGRQSSVVIRLGAPSDLPSPVELTIFCVLLRACAY